MVVKLKEKKAKYKEMSCLELSELIDTLKKDLFTVKQNVKRATHKENSDIKKMKKEIAMLKTFINQKGGMAVVIEEKRAKSAKGEKKVAAPEKKAVAVDKKVAKKPTVKKPAAKKVAKETTKKAASEKAVEK